jgi:hypothetical protein
VTACRRRDRIGQVVRVVPVVEPLDDPVEQARISAPLVQQGLSAQRLGHSPRVAVGLEVRIPENLDLVVQGLVGLVLGLAAQKSISTLLAGIQLSLTQPIRLGDQVVVEGEFGTVEEITLTYVVVRVWDERRLVVPIIMFLDKPFQNWSRSGTSMLGHAILQVDYSTDIDALRVELKRILENEGRGLWDGKVQNVVVLDVQDKTLSVRALVSAVDPGKLFDLRCLVRERLIVFLRGRSEWLPTVRTATRQITPPGEQAGSGPAPAPRA